MTVAAEVKLAVPQDGVAPLTALFADEVGVLHLLVMPYLLELSKGDHRLALLALRRLRLLRLQTLVVQAQSTSLPFRLSLICFFAVSAGRVMFAFI